MRASRNLVRHIHLFSLQDTRLMLDSIVIIINYQCAQTPSDKEISRAIGALAYICRHFLWLYAK